MTAVYVVTTTPFITSALPQVFKELEGSTGAKEFVSREWGVKVSRIAPTEWIAIESDYVVKINKRPLM